MVQQIVGSIPCGRPIEVFLNLHPSSWWNGLSDQSLVADLLRYFSIFTPAHGLLDQSLVADLLRYFSIFTPAHGEMDCWINPLWQTYWGISQSSSQLMDCWINPLWQTYWGISQSSPQLMVKWIVGSIPCGRPIEVFLNLHPSSWWNGLFDQSLVTDLLRYFSIFTPAHGEMDCRINPLWQTYWGISQSSPQLMVKWIVGSITCGRPTDLV